MTQQYQNSQLRLFEKGLAKMVVCGESMTPKYRSGSLLTLKEIDPDLIIYGQDHVLRFGERLVFRRLEPSQKSGYVRAVPYNTVDTAFSPQDIPLSKVKALYVVTSCLEQEINY